MRNRSNRRRGHALLESALVLPILTFVLIGTFDFGQVMFIHQSLTERTRKAVRYGATHYSDTGAVRNMVLYGTPTMPPGIQPAGYLGMTASMVEVTRLGAGTKDDRMMVKVRDYPFHFFTPWIARAYQGKPIAASAPVESVN